MNEKVLELADKAYNDNYKIIGHADIPDQFCYAFAELIINECIQAIDNVGGFNEEFHMNVIKQHFGVK